MNENINNDDCDADFINLHPPSKIVHENISPKSANIINSNLQQNFNNINPNPDKQSSYTNPHPNMQPKINQIINPCGKKSEVSDKDIKKIAEIIDKKIKPLDTSKFHKKLDFDLPVKFKTPNHYKLNTIIIKLMSNAKKDMESNNIDKAREGLELASYYLTKIIQ